MYIKPIFLGVTYPKNQTLKFAFLGKAGFPLYLLNPKARFKRMPLQSLTQNPFFNIKITPCKK